MDVPCPEWMKHVEQKWTRLESAARERFPVFTDIDDLFHFGLSQLQPEDLETLSKISEKYPMKKSSQYATRYRQQGNEQFKEKDYTSAVLCYTKGVCHAETNTEELSLCYANRSAALFHLGFYNECLEDIQRAFDEGYPSRLQCKLIDRRTCCTNLVEMQKYMNSTAKDQNSQINKGSNTTGSSAVSVHFTTENGRNLLATENKSAGEIIFEDEAFSFVLIPVIGQYTKSGKDSKCTTEPRHCFHCLCENFNPIPCRGCSYAQYCGQRCETEAWKQYHYLECSVVSELLALGVFAHLALRVTLKAGLKEVQRARESSFNLSHKVQKATVASGNGTFINDEPWFSRQTSDSLELMSELNAKGPLMSNKCFQDPNHSSCYHGKSYLGIYSLLTHVEKHNPNLCFLFAFTMAALSQRLSLDVPPCHDQEGSVWCRSERSLLGATALRHVLQLQCNAQAVTAIKFKDDPNLLVQSSEELRIATAVFPVLSLLNHSCQPNASISFNVGFSASSSSNPGYIASGVTVTVRACRDISSGQELLHCYGPHCSRLDVEKRQRLLLWQYFFLCKCEACKLELADRSRMTLTSNNMKCEKCGSLLKMSEDVHVCSKSSCDHYILNTELQRRTQILQHHLEQALELMENHQINGALTILQEATNLADKMLMKIHPLQGELADAMARAYATMGLWRQAASHLKSSLGAICSQYGKDSMELGRQQFKLAQLYFNGGDGPSALSVIPLAQHLLSLHCGSDCKELQELHAMEDCLCRTK